MNELESVKIHADLSTFSLIEQTNFRLNKINKIKDYFESERKKRVGLIKTLSKYITCFDYCDNILIVFWTIFSGVSTFSHLKITNHTGLISSVLILIFSLSTRIIKKLLMTQKRQRKNIIKSFI